MMSRPGRVWMACLLFAMAPSAGWARGPSPYLPLNLTPEIERQIERVLILADRPVLTRPIATAAVLDALPAACRIDKVLCRSVRRYLDRYMHKIGVGHASAEVAAADGVATSLPNRHGMSSDSAWQASVQAYWQPTDHILLSLGGVAHEDDVVPTGSMLSLGFDVAQLDVGYRDHWLSPFTDSAMLMSTQAATLPSITLSNYKPITGLGVRYEIFLAEMERSDGILFQNRFTSGKPRLAGMHFSIEPTPGWSLSANRVMQFGGGERGGRGFGDFFDALFKPSQVDNSNAGANRDQEFGNQAAALTSRFIFPGSTPFSVYMEYAGEDTSYSQNHRLGNSALSVGVTFPRLWRRFDLTYEASEWQNAWYVHSIYADGLTNEGHVIGHWGADARVTGDAVGAQTHMLRVGWEPGFGGLMQLRARTIENESYSTVDYERGYDMSLSYARTLRGFTAGAELTAGRDVFGEDFSRVAGFVRFGDEWAGGSSEMWDEGAQRPRGADLFVDTGINVGRTQVRLGDGSPTYWTSTQTSPHIGIGARRAVTTHGDLGVRAELDRIDGEMLLAVRALDYRYRFDNPLAVTAFLGAARYSLATPAYGYYVGVGLQWRDILPRFDLNLEGRYADKVARDKLLPGDPATNPRPDIFYDIMTATLSLSYRF